MNLRRHTLGLVLLSCVSAAPALADDEGYRLEPGTHPLSQRVDLRLDPAAERFSGSVSIELERDRPGRQLQFNGLEYTIRSAKLSGAAKCALKTTMGKLGVVTAECARELPKGRYTLAIEFDAPYNRQSVGLYKTEDQGLPYLFTQFEMSDARRAFPVFDEPEFKIPFALTISAPSALKVYANTREKAHRAKDGWTTHEFAATQPIPAYLVAYAVGPFEEVAVEGLKVPGRVITTKGKSKLAHYAAGEIPKIMAALEGYFGRPYPYDKLDSAALPEYPFGAMENAGLITYREDILLVDPEHASVEQKAETLEVIAHEMAHQWFGDLVTMKWWNDLWLNEAFASWMAAKIVAQQYPELHTDLDLPQNGVMPSDALLSTRPIRKPIRTEADIMDGLGLAYSKGSAVLSLVEQWIGVEAFQRGIRAYLDAHAFKNAEADDLWSALGAASKQDVRAVLGSFIEQSSFPLIQVSLDGKTLKLAQRRFAYPGAAAPPQRWSVPVNIKYGDGKRQATTSVLLREERADVALEFEPTWVYPDTEAKGYYRFQLDAALRERSLPQFDAKNLSVRERRALIAGSESLFNAGQMDAATFMRTVGRYLDDPHPRVVGSALGYLNDLRRTFVDAKNEAAWSRYVVRIAQPALKRYGLTSRGDDAVGVNGVRARLVELAGVEGRDEAVLAASRAQVDAFIADPNAADPALIDAQLEVAAHFGDAKLFDRMQHAFETTTNPTARTSLLVALSYFADPALQQRALDYMLTDKLTASDLTSAFRGQFDRPERAARARAWFYAHFDAVRKKLPPFVVPVLPRVFGDECNEAIYDEAEKFFAPRAAEEPGYARSLEQAKDSVGRCVALRAREAASFDAQLQQKG